MTDPKGLLYMANDLVIDVSKVEAPIEVWKHGDLADAEGLTKKDVWKKKRVMTDILEHRMTSFSHEQQDQWRALNEFHNSFQCSDDVPPLPLTLRAGASS